MPVTQTSRALKRLTSLLTWGTSNSDRFVPSPTGRSASGEAVFDRHMNVLFVFSDQQRYSALGANGNPVVRTPNLDRMAAEGLLCDNMFSNHPLC